MTDFKTGEKKKTIANKNESGRVGVHSGLTPEQTLEFHGLRERLIQGIHDPQEAREVLEQLRQYADPIITVSESIAKEIDLTGVLMARKTWVPGSKMIVGSIGTKPYAGIGDLPRKILRISRNVPLEPRFTGPDKSFHGVVIIKKGSLFLGQDIEYIE